jgi:hypothetical protein
VFEKHIFAHYGDNVMTLYANARRVIKCHRRTSVFATPLLCEAAKLSENVDLYSYDEVYLRCGVGPQNLHLWCRIPIRQVFEGLELLSVSSLDIRRKHHWSKISIKIYLK